MPIASYIQKYFWEINPRKARPKAHPEYYIKRILELGDKNAPLWLKIVFGKKRIGEVAKRARLSPKAQNFWKLIFSS